MAGRVLASHNYCSVSFPKQVLGVHSRPLGPAHGTCTCTHLHTPAHLPCLRQALAAGFAAVHPLLEAGPGPSSLLPPTLSAPKVPGAPQEPCSRQVSASPFWVFHEDGEEENTSMNSMFLRCLIKRDKTAEEFGAGLAGVGSHALLPCVCRFWLSRASCSAHPTPSSGTGPRLEALRMAGAPDAQLSQGCPSRSICSTRVSWLGRGKQPSPESLLRAVGGAQGPGAKPSRGATSPYPVHWLALCMLCSPHTCCAAPADPEVHTVKCIFLLVLIPEDFMGVAEHHLEPTGTQEHPGGHERQACPSPWPQCLFKWGRGHCDGERRRVGSHTRV